MKITSTVNNELLKFTCLPLQADFEDVVSGKKSKISLELTNIDTTISEIITVSNPISEYIKKTKIKKRKLKPGQTTKIEFELSKTAPIGNFSTSLTIEAANKKNSRMTIPVIGSIVAKTIKSKEQSGK